MKMTPCCIQTLHKKPFSAIAQSDRIDLITKGRPTPALARLTATFEGNIIQFDPVLYSRHDWLCGSEEVNAVFCWPCLLFAQDRISYWTKLGYKDVGGLVKAAASHEESIGHIRSRFMFSAFVNKNMAVPKQAAEKTVYNPVLSRNNKFLMSIIDVTHILLDVNALFDVHTQQYISLKNLLRVVEATCDDKEMISALLENDPAEALQFVIDCEEAIAKAIEESVKNELKETQFVTLIVDESPDTPGKIFIGLRYIYDNKLVERMLGFLDMKDCDVPTGIQEYIQEMDLGQKLIAQAWGGTTCTPQALRYCQETIKTQTTATMFLPYNVTDFIATLVQSMSNIPSVNAFFTGLDRIRSLFLDNPAVFKGFLMEESLSPDNEPASLLSSIIQGSKHSFVFVVKEHRERLIEKFKEILEQEQLEDRIAGEISQSCVYLEDPLVILYLGAFQTIFAIIHGMMKWISGASEDGFTVTKIRDIFNKTQMELDVANNKFHEQEDIGESAKHDITQAIGIIVSTMQPRLENIERFKFFRLFLTSRYRMYMRTFPDDLMSHLVAPYSALFNRTRLKNELLVMYGTPDFQTKTPQELFQSFVDDSTLETIFPQIHKLLLLIFTLPSHLIPVTNGPLPDRVRSHTRKFVGQPRVSELAVIDVNVDLLQSSKKSREFFQAFLEDLATKQRDMQIKYDEQSYGEMEAELAEIKVEQDRVQFSSLLSTERSIALLNEAEDVAGKTSKTLVEQREKLEKTSGNLKQINDSLKVSQKNINKMKGFFTRLKAFFPAKRGNNEVASSKAASTVEEVIQEEIVTATTTTQPCAAVQEYESDSDSSDDFPTRRNSMDDKISTNLDIISNQISDLKSMAIHMGQEISLQNSLLDNIMDEAERVDATIVEQDLQIKKLLR